MVKWGKRFQAEGTIRMPEVLELGKPGDLTLHPCTLPYPGAPAINTLYSTLDMKLQVPEESHSYHPKVKIASRLR